MSWYIDDRLILNLDYLVESHVVDGNAAFDGVYGIVYVIRYHDTVKEQIVAYTDEAKRNTAFLALGEHCKESQK